MTTSSIQTLKQLRLDRLLQLGRTLGLLLAHRLALLRLSVNTLQLRSNTHVGKPKLLDLHAQLAHSLQVLLDTQETSLIPANEELRPVLEVLLDLRNGLLLVLRKLDLFPQVLG